MAIKNRILKNLELAENNVIEAKKRQERDFFEYALKNLLIARDLSQKGLNTENYRLYDEIYNGLVLALKDLTKNGFADELISLSSEFLIYLKNQIENEKNFKKEIVFLCYQASMWDSLESVWKAASEDKEHCISYVVPVPYANKNKDDTIDKWHLDIDKFPYYVPVINFKDIDLQELHPDIIFFNNPYDGFNSVTTLDENCYSKKLRQYTDKLIYIPYFVLNENESNENIKNYAYLPGVLNADLIIVQSESMREKYIDALLKVPNTDRKYWENRVLGTGSPKIDKVLTSKKEDFSLPKDWENLIKNKKVILYNTSISIIYKDAKNVIKKMRLIFDYFKSRTDVVLWWRPHPLIKYTLHSIDLNLEKEYLKLEKEYVKNKIGIYDKTGDLHRAICYSDMYYGDGSSVVGLYRYTGKAIVVQDVSLNVEADLRIGFLDVYIEDDKLWGISNENYYNLYEIDLKDDTIMRLGELPINYSGIYGYIILEKIKDRLIIAPCLIKDDMVIYDLKKKEFNRIPLKQECFPKDHPAFIYGFKHNDKVFILGSRTGIILEYDYTTKQIIYHDEWSMEISKKIGVENIDFSRQGYAKIGNCFYMVVMMTNLIVKLNIDTFETSVIEIPYDYKAVSLCYDGEYFWFTPEGHNFIIRWNEKINEFKKINLPKQVKDIFGSVVLGEDIALVPFIADSFFKINKKTFHVTNDKKLEKLFNRLSIKYNWLNNKTNKVFAGLFNNFIHEFNSENGELIIHKIKFDFFDKSNRNQRNENIKLVGKIIYNMISL